MGNVNDASHWGWNRESISKISLLISISIFVFSAFILLISTAGFMMGITLSKWQIVLSWLLGALFLYYLTGGYFKKDKLKWFMLTMVCFLLIFGISIMISNVFYDFSWDGQAYHQETIIHLYNGWDPVYQSLGNAPYSIWSEHYSKNGEMLAASLYMLTGRIETGKAFNLLFIVASFFISLALLLNFRTINPLGALVTALIIALNPVSVCQAFSFYIDGLLASAIVSLIAAGVLIYKKPDRVSLGLFLALILVLVNLKFTGLIYVVLLIAGLLIPLWVTKKSATLKKVGIISILGLFLGFFLIGFSPYITNTIGHQHPFYPLFKPGKDKIDAVTEITPVYFDKMNRFQSLIDSLFAQPQSHFPGEKLILKIPFTVSKWELVWFFYPDVRAGGFGPLFSGIITLFIVLVFIYSLRFIRNHEIDRRKWFFYLMLVVFGTVIINPVTWWARYIPQLWLIPICMIPFLAYENNQVLKIGKYLLIGVFLLNIYLIGSVNYMENLHHSQTLRRQLREMAVQKKVVDVFFGYFPSNRVRFAEMGIKYREYKDEKELESKEKTTTIIWPNVKVGLTLNEK